MRRAIKALKLLGSLTQTLTRLDCKLHGVKRVSLGDKDRSGLGEGLGYFLRCLNACCKVPLLLGEAHMPGMMAAVCRGGNSAAPQHGTLAV